MHRTLHGMACTERALAWNRSPRPSYKHWRFAPKAPLLSPSHYYLYSLMGRTGKKSQGQNLLSLSAGRGLLLTGLPGVANRVSFCPSPQVFLIPDRVSSLGNCASHFIFNIITFPSLLKNSGPLYPFPSIGSFSILSSALRPFRS